MSFWDASALLPLCLEEPASAAMRRLLRSHGAPVVWWASLVECHSALERQARAGEMTFAHKGQAERILHHLADGWTEIQPTHRVRERSLRLLAVHNLRAADALQLAAALVWAAEQPAGRTFVCLDVRLRESAQREGFLVAPAGDF